MLNKIKKTKEAMAVARDFQKVLCSSCKRKVMKQIKKHGMAAGMDSSLLCDKCRGQLQDKAQDRGKDNLEGML